jgi:glycosyltransferase involved in cell wall biosynthesis
MKIVALPRDPNPYQRLLYDACARRGAEVEYAGELTPSHTLNLLLLPAELVARRLAGARVLHIHWLFGFSLPARRLAAVWLRFVLLTARAIGMHIVWTAHNVLPHAPIFHDDVAARRALVRASDLVIAHSPAARDEVARSIAEPHASTVIPHGPFEVERATNGRSADAPLGLLFFGSVEPYKGVEDLLEALDRVSADVPLRVTVAGRCSDSELRARLIQLAKSHADRVSLRLERIPDDELPALLGAHDVLVLPFRRVTTSGSAMLGIGAGMPVVVPDQDEFRDLPVVRYSGGVDGLAKCLRDLADGGRDQLDELGRAARDWSRGTSWDDIGASTVDAFEEVVSR